MNKFTVIYVSREDLIKALESTSEEIVGLGIEQDSIEGDLILWANNLSFQSKATIINKPRSNKDKE